MGALQGRRDEGRAPANQSPAGTFLSGGWTISTSIAKHGPSLAPRPGHDVSLISNHKRDRSIYSQSTSVSELHTILFHLEPEALQRNRPSSVRSDQTSKYAAGQAPLQRRLVPGRPLRTVSPVPQPPHGTQHQHEEPPSQSHFLAARLIWN